MVKYFTFIALSQSRSTASLSLLHFLRFLSTTQPSLSPSLSVITGSTVFVTTHHRFHPIQHHPSPALPSPSPPITSSMSSAPPPVLKFSQCHCQSCSFFKYYLAGFLEVGLWWDLLLVGRRWIWNQDCTVFG